MKLVLHNNFIKNFNKRVKPYSKLNLQYQKRVNLLITDSSNPLLQIHQLTGNKAGYWAFSINGDVRVIFIRTESELIFYDIGSHNQVY